MLDCKQFLFILITEKKTFSHNNNEHFKVLQKFLNKEDYAIEFIDLHMTAKPFYIRVTLEIYNFILKLPRYTINID